ncbi:MAG: FAD-dependent oxidoreductase, partial [Gaiellaceae bacterium]|nr:FAD-dependent oxidoreductase [Gaiellaceae bacterium]
MPSYRYLVVGGGMTADAAARGIREHDGDGTIAVFCAEPHPPYARPPLSKGLWSGRDEDSIWRGTADLGVELHVGRRIVELDLPARAVVDDTGERHRFEKLLLAIGGRPRKLPDAPAAVIALRTLDDYRRLRALAGEGVRVAVVGGGFIGSEIAAALSTAGCRVTLLFPEEGIGRRLFPAGLASFLNDAYRERGVEVRAGELVTAIDSAGGALRVVTDGGAVVVADAVVTGLGIVPASELAEAAGLPVEDGIVVDELGRVDGRDDVYAAGDVARFPVAALGGTMRVE